MILYKYYSPKLYNFEAVRDRKFYLSTNAQLNDPYDLFSGNILWETLTTKSNPMRKRIQETLNFIEQQNYPDKKINTNEQDISIIEKTFRQFASCSFTTNPLDRLMWAHYADSYSGFCIGIEIGDDMVDPGYSNAKDWHRVMYVDQIPSELLKYVGKTKDPHKFNNVHSGLISMEYCLRQWIEKQDVNILKDYICQLLCIKAQEWVYEQEVRLVKDVPSDHFVSWDSYAITLKEIILGSKFHSVKKDVKVETIEAEQILKEIKSKSEQQIPIFQLALNNQQYFTLNKEPYILRK